MLRGIESTDILLSPVHEVVCATAVEPLLGLRRERKRAAAATAPSIFRAALEQCIEQLSVVRGDILHRRHVLIAPFNLEAANASICQCFKVFALVVVLHAQHVLVVRHDAPEAVLHRVGQAAFLRAVAAVGAAAGVRMANEALAAVGHAQRTVDEELEFRFLHFRGDGADLLQGEFACQYQLREPGILQEPRLLWGANVGLGAGMQLDGRQVQFQQAHVLNNQGIHAGFVELPGLAPRRFQFVIPQDGVHRHEDAGPEAMGVLSQARNFCYRVARLVAGAHGRAANVDGVRAMVDSLDADIGISGGGEQFQVRVPGGQSFSHLPSTENTSSKLPGEWL